ncbi:hypothetical protein FQN57_007305 [Myotisia sp. PD_48]|nr:hypothetical protein FQN57_007305 [Myotisia sp. PD_48]
MGLTRSLAPLFTPNSSVLNVRQMTGLDSKQDQILQICCYVTDAELNLLDTDGFETTIHHPKETLDKMNAWCVETHGKSGLTAAVLASTQTPEEAAGQLLAYIKGLVPTQGTALLAGNSVHADQAFLVHEPYKQVLDWLHYRILDVSSVKEAVRRWSGDAILRQAPGKAGLHLAREDILESIEEMRFYKQAIFKSPVF